jgi:hypothetical protein
MTYIGKRFIFNYIVPTPASSAKGCFKCYTLLNKKKRPHQK